MLPERRDYRGDSFLSERMRHLELNSYLDSISLQTRRGEKLGPAVILWVFFRGLLHDGRQTKIRQSYSRQGEEEEAAIGYRCQYQRSVVLRSQGQDRKCASLYGRRSRLCRRSV